MVSLQRIQQPDATILCLHIRIPGETLSLLICVDPPFARLHFTCAKLSNPTVPLPFCQFLRAHLNGARIEAVESQPQDRIVYIQLTKGTTRSTLVVALTGKQANVFVLDDRRTILRTLKPSRQAAGMPYEPPQSRTAATAGSTDAETAPPHVVVHDAQFGKRFPISSVLDAYYQQEERRDSNARAYRSEISRLGKALKHAKRRQSNLESELQKAEQYREYRRYGELLKTQLHAIQAGQSSIDLVDYFDANLPTLSLPLNPLKDAVWNMEDYFRKYKKFISAQEHLGPRLQQTQSEIISLQQELDTLRQQELDHLVSGTPLSSISKPKEGPSPDLPTVPRKHQNRLAAHRSAIKGTRMPQTPQQNRPHLPTKHYRRYESHDGLTILVGKSATDNDYLTLKVAKPNDLWLHARGVPGSHVVVRMEKAIDVPHETLRDAATLALFYSDLKKSGKGEVIYTLRKFVKKPKGLKAGAVQVTREKSLWVEIKDERLHRLRDSGSPV